MASAKCVIAGKISIACSGLGGPSRPTSDPLDPNCREPATADLGGLLRVWRKGWALRLDERSDGGCLADFIVCGGRGGGFGYFDVSAGRFRKIVQRKLMVIEKLWAVMLADELHWRDV